MAERRYDDQAVDQELGRILREWDIARCRACGRLMDRGDLAWNNGQTEAGTEFSVVYVTCQACGTEMLQYKTWYTPIDDVGELVWVLDHDIGKAYAQARRAEKTDGKT